MRITKVIDDLLDSLRKERESLEHILLSGKISHGTYNLLNEKIEKAMSAASDLRKALEDEEEFWKRTLHDGARLFETILVEFRHRLLLGDMNEDEYKRSAEILSDGISSIKKQIEWNGEEREETIIMSSQQIRERYANKLADVKGGDETSNEAVKTTSTTGESREGEIHCMNPWKPECRNTDIEVSIYYNGRMIPICRKCWSEIANKDIEWSSI
ncbi:CdvA-like protein [Candidatus Bathyarchaeota archaeon]|nr:CdvA-like protein [Candidatus Bathyarchaeota archaeon]